MMTNEDMMWSDMHDSVVHFAVQGHFNGQTSEQVNTCIECVCTIYVTMLWNKGIKLNFKFSVETTCCCQQ